MTNWEDMTEAQKEEANEAAWCMAAGYPAKAWYELLFGEIASDDA